MDDREREIEALSREVSRRVARRAAGWIVGALGVGVIVLALLPPYTDWIESWAGNTASFVGMFVTIAAGAGLLHGAAKLFDPNYHG